MTELLFEGPSGPRLQMKHLAALVRNEGFKFTDTFFPYASGEIGPYFVYSETVMKNGQDYHEACKDLANGIALKKQRGDRVEVISGGESRDWIFSCPVAANLGLPPFSIYKNGRTLGANVMDKMVLHVADLNHQGSSIRDYILPSLTRAKAFVNDVVFFIDRMEGGRQVIKDLGLNASALVRLDDSAWDYLAANKVVDYKTYENLKRRGKTKEERDYWAKQMLRSSPGQIRLAQLFDDDKTREKVRKVLVEGYPHMMDELIDTIRRHSESGLDVNEWIAKV